MLGFDEDYGRHLGVRTPLFDASPIEPPFFRGAENTRRFAYEFIEVQHVGSLRVFVNTITSVGPHGVAADRWPRTRPTPARSGAGGT